jgi:hypothetical protein
MFGVGVVVVRDTYIVLYWSTQGAMHGPGRVY